MTLLGQNVDSYLWYGGGLRIGVHMVVVVMMVVGAEMRGWWGC